MEHETQIKNCQNCKQDFEITSDDFSFYEKIKVPPPTFCPGCRLQRRLAWRNERVLYRDKCDLCNKNIISMYGESVSFPVYCRDCWLGDGWDPMSYGQEFEPSRPFFEQYKELLYSVPRIALWQRNSTNSEYSNMAAESKNVYLSVSVVAGSENVSYSKSIDKSKDIIDSTNINVSENLYESIEAQGSYGSQFLLLSRACLDSYYLVDCVNCSNCFMSYNLRNKQYCIRNKQYTREDYLKELAKINLKSRKERDALLAEFEDMKKRAIYRFANTTKSVDSTGNNLANTKNCHNCFDVHDSEDSKYCYRAFKLKDCMDFDYGESEMMYEYTTGAKNDYNVRFSYSAMDAVRDAEYTDFCRNVSNVFGGAGLHNAQYVILNKAYSKEEFESLREKIINQMMEKPFVDKAGRVYKYGEFLPIEFSPWAYDETIALDFFPITEQQARENGYNWIGKAVKSFDITVPAENIPDNIDEVDEGILKEVLGCAHKGGCADLCGVAFRLTDFELNFYKKFGIPLPVLCPNCRFHKRLKVMPGLKLHHRKCTREGCENEFETAYAPDRPEIVYCEKCYQQEVY